jgi:hypothetical protein
LGFRPRGGVGNAMKWHILILSAALGFAGPVWTRGFSPETSKPGKPARDFMAGSQIWIEGNSSLQRYFLTGGPISAKSDLNGDSKTKALVALILNRKGHKLVVTLPVKSLKSGDPNMDRTAYDKLKAVDFPNITFTLGNYEVRAFPKSLNTYALLVSGKLRVAGVEKDVVLEPTMVLGKNGIRIYGTQDVYQKDYGISPYSVALVMTTDNKVVVHYMIALGPK